MTKSGSNHKRGSSTNVKVLLLTAGKATRLRPLTDAIPKCLVPIAGRPLLDYWLYQFALVGVREILVNTHHLREQVGTYINAVNNQGRFRMIEAYEPKLLGSAGTIHANRDFVHYNEDCFIVYGDNLSDVDLNALLCVHRSFGAPITMTLFHASHPKQCGIASINGNGIITEFVEKPRRPKNNLANAGIYAVSGEAYHEIADMSAFDLAQDVLPKFVGRMRGWVWDGYHRDIGTPDSLAQARRDVDTAFCTQVSDTA